MSEDHRLVKGLITAHIIAFSISYFIAFLTDLLTGLIIFAVTLPIAAYLTPQILEKMPLN